MPPTSRSVEPLEAAGLESVILTEELLTRRTVRPPDYASENRSLVALAEAMTSEPDRILERLAGTALELCGAHSAGFSLLDRDPNRFRWSAVVGRWADHAGGGTPRDFGPCGTVLDRGVPLLFKRPERYFPYLASVQPFIQEGLLLPFEVGGKAVGTIWVISHSETCRFDAEDLRVMTSLAKFAAAAYQTRLAIEALEKANKALQLSAVELTEANRRAEKLKEEKLHLEDELQAEGAFPEIVCRSSALTEVLTQVKTVATTDATVLLAGETGTGKELIARAIHDLSARNDNAFVKVNCAAIPLGLLESELFGHEKGAFTGAVSQKLGRFDLAHRGTLFLDEVGDIPLELQPKLLRVLQEQEFERLGSSRTVRVDVRVIAATNRNLPQMVTDRQFRNDLYYRLNVFPIRVPPLRDRREDIPTLVHHFVKKHAVRMNRAIETIPSDVMDALVRWHWPGNVRELGNFLERSVILTRGPVLRAPVAELASTSPDASAVTLESAEREAIVRALRATGGVIGGHRGAAARLGLKRTTLNAKMQRLGISRKDL